MELAMTEKSEFCELSRVEQDSVNGGKTIVFLSPCLSGIKLGFKYLLSFSDDFRKGIGAGVDDARRDYENGLVD